MATPIYGFPEPTDADVADGPVQIGALSAGVEAALGPKNATTGKHEHEEYVNRAGDTMEGTLVQRGDINAPGTTYHTVTNWGSLISVYPGFGRFLIELPQDYMMGGVQGGEVILEIRGYHTKLVPSEWLLTVAGSAGQDSTQGDIATWRHPTARITSSAPSGPDISALSDVTFVALGQFPGGDPIRFGIVVGNNVNLDDMAFVVDARFGNVMPPSFVKLPPKLSILSDNLIPAEWTWQQQVTAAISDGGGSGGAQALDDLTDVDTTTVAPVADNALVFDGTNWIPGDVLTQDEADRRYVNAAGDSMEGLLEQGVAPAGMQRWVSGETTSWGTAYNAAAVTGHMLVELPVPQVPIWYITGGVFEITISQDAGSLTPKPPVRLTISGGNVNTSSPDFSAIWASPSASCLAGDDTFLPVTFLAKGVSGADATYAFAIGVDAVLDFSIVSVTLRTSFSLWGRFPLSPPTITFVAGNTIDPAWTWQASITATRLGGGGGATTLDGLTDVDTTTTPPVAGNTLVFDGTLWEPGTPAGGGGGLDQATADGLYVNIAGDTMTGKLTINNELKVSGVTWVDSGHLRVGTSSGIDARVVLGSGGTGSANERWTFLRNTNPESTGNAGSNLELQRANDSGVKIDAVLTASRATGEITITHPLTLTDPVPTLPNHAASKQYVDAAGGGGGAQTLDDLTDVSAGSPSDGQALIWNQTAATWNPATVSSGGGTLPAAGAGLTGGATSYEIGAGTGITVNTDDVAINRAVADTWYEATGAVAAHVALADPHTQYLTQAEADPLYSPTAHAHTLDSLTDVTGTGATVGQALVSDGAGLWAPGTVASGGLDQATADGLYVNVAGDTMTGALQVPDQVATPPATATTVTARAYVDQLVTVSVAAPTTEIPVRDNLVWMVVP